MIASYPVFKPLTLPDFQNGNDSNPPNRANQRNVSEMSRLFDALGEVVPVSQIGPWLDIPNPAFEGSTPLQVIERGESDRPWRMIWELRMGKSGD